MENGETRFTSFERGVKPLVALLERGEDLRGALAADKVVGNATAFLYRLLGVRGVYARVISEPALKTLQSHGIFVIYDELARAIVNRQGDGICPFERAVSGVDDDSLAYSRIQEKMRVLGISFESLQ